MAIVTDDGNGTGGDTTTTLGTFTRQDRLRTELSYGEDWGGLVGAGGSKYYTDPSTELAINKGYFIEIYHIISGVPVFFKAFLTDFTDNFTTNYNKEQVFGRSDPIQTYQNTERVINVAFDLVSSNINEARANILKANNLISMMYPSYEESGTANSIKSGPLFKVKMGNLICMPGLTEENGTSPAEKAGLGCTIGGFKYNPIIEDGFFDPKPGIFYPQTIKIDLELSILHEKALGFQGNVSNTTYDQLVEGETDKKAGFPYGGNPALSLNGGTGDVRASLPSSITQGNRIREGTRPGIRTTARLEARVASERFRVQANKILSPQNRNRAGNILSDPEGTFDDFIIKGYFP